MEEFNPTIFFCQAQVQGKVKSKVSQSVKVKVLNYVDIINSILVNKKSKSVHNSLSWRYTLKKVKIDINKIENTLHWRRIYISYSSTVLSVYFLLLRIENCFEKMHWWSFFWIRKESFWVSKLSLRSGCVPSLWGLKLKLGQ